MKNKIILKLAFFLILSGFSFKTAIGFSVSNISSYEGFSENIKLTESKNPKLKNNPRLPTKRNFSENIPLGSNENFQLTNSSFSGIGFLIKETTSSSDPADNSKSEDNSNISSGSSNNTTNDEKNNSAADKNNITSSSSNSLSGSSNSYSSSSSTVKTSHGRPANRFNKNNTKGNEQNQDLIETKIISKTKDVKEKNIENKIINSLSLNKQKENILSLKQENKDLLNKISAQFSSNQEAVKYLKVSQISTQTITSLQNKEDFLKTNFHFAAPLKQDNLPSKINTNFKFFFYAFIFLVIFFLKYEKSPQINFKIHKINYN